MSQEFCIVTQSLTKATTRIWFKECFVKPKYTHVLGLYLGQLHAWPTLLAQDTISRLILEFLLPAVSGFTHRCT